MDRSLKFGNSTPAVYTVILNWNQVNITLECLESLRKSDYRDNTIVVVDNGSSDGSCTEIPARYPEVRMLCQPKNFGYGEGNNAGIRYALEQGADYILLLNNDTVVAPDMLSKLVQVCEADPKNGMAGPLMYYYDEPSRIAAAGSQVDIPSGTFWNRFEGEEQASRQMTEIEEVDFIVSCGVLVRRETVEQIGLLDGRYFINIEDIDWGLKAKKAGYRVLFVPKAKMWHRLSAATGQFSPTTVYYITRNGFLLFSTHLTGWPRLRALALNSVRTVRTITAWSIKPKYRSFRRHRQANLYALRDAFLGRYGKMGEDVAAVCYPKK